MKLTQFEKEVIQVFSKHYGRDETALVNAYTKIGNIFDGLRISLDLADAGINDWWYIIKEMEKNIKLNKKKNNFNPLHN